MASTLCPATPKYDAEGKLQNLGELITYLGSIRSRSSTMISLVVHCTTDLPRTAALLSQELSCVCGIRGRRNRLAVVAALTAARQKVLEYDTVPYPGIAIFCGMAVTDHGQQKIDLDFRLPAPALDNKDVFRCDVKFYTEALIPLYVNNEDFRCVAVVGHDEALFVLQYESRHCVIGRKAAPDNVFVGERNHIDNFYTLFRRGKRKQYIEEVADLMAQYFLSDDFLQSCGRHFKGVLLGGVLEFVTDIASYDELNPRLRVKLMGIADVMSEADGYTHAQQLLPLVLEYPDVSQTPEPIVPPGDNTSPDNNGIKPLTSDKQKVAESAASHNNVNELDWFDQDEPPTPIVPSEDSASPDTCDTNSSGSEEQKTPDNTAPHNTVNGLVSVDWFDQVGMDGSLPNTAPSEPTDDSPTSDITSIDNQDGSDYICYLEDSCIESTNSTNAPNLDDLFYDLEDKSEDDFVFVSSKELESSDESSHRDNPECVKENEDGCNVM